MSDKRQITADWFRYLRDQICASYEQLEAKYCNYKNIKLNKFERKIWQREGGGGGEMSIMRGRLFEKVGVNISTVFGEFSPEFSKAIPGTEENPQFFATGISVVAHMCSPLIPAVHFNTRYIETSKTWFGGGSDLTPIYFDEQDTVLFHQALKEACDNHDTKYYPDFKKKCDEYFYLHHRKEPRGIGGIFYDYLNTNNFEADFAFTQDVGEAFLDIYPQIVEPKMFHSWTEEQRNYQLIKRGRYVEYNLLYDRGTTFGLKTGGNVEAILMSLPPEVRWS